MLLKLSRKSQELTKEAFLGTVAKGVGKAALGVGKGVGKATVAVLKTKPGRAIAATTALVGGMGAAGAYRGTGAMHMQNPHANPFTGVQDTIRGGYQKVQGAMQ